ncbi:MAG TPA: hypothetical protein VF765_18080 [Polyangiaceae bacterium]
MSSSGWAAATLGAMLLAVAGCGGGGKGADSPGTCPDGTVLKGEDCVPSDDSSSSGSGSGSSGKSAKKDDDDDDSPPSSSASSSSSSASSSSDSSSAGASGGSTPYDKDAVEAQLKRAARQVKSGCGSASGDDGQRTGPWGSTKASVVLGRNGHVKQVTVPDPYNGKPVGDCVINAFKKIQFPPYAGSSDVVVDWDVELVQPKK